MAFKDLRDERTYEEARADERLWRQARSLGVSRRRFLQMVAAAGVTAAVGTPLRKVLAQQPTPAAPLVVKPTPADLFYDFASNKEMRWENMYGRGYVVPNDLFFVRNHTRTPRVDAATWRLKIEGSGVQRPVDLSLDDLLGMSSVSVHHGGGVGIGYSIHAGQVVVADGTPLAAQKLERVLTTDPGTGVIRHADAGYPEALEAARRGGIRLPMREE